MIEKMSEEYFHIRDKGIVKSECSQALKKTPDRLRFEQINGRVL